MSGGGPSAYLEIGIQDSEVFFVGHASDTHPLKKCHPEEVLRKFDGVTVAYLPPTLAMGSTLIYIPIEEGAA